MTGYTLKAGYCSEYGPESDKPWQIILEAVKSITYVELLDEYHGPIACEKGCCFPLEMAKYMTTEQGCDSSVIVNCERKEVSLLASGHGDTRRMKECMRRAFIRCVLRRADKSYVDVDVASG